MGRIQIAYFVHDLNDPAVARRVRMLRAAGAIPMVLGFRRDEMSPERVAGATAIDLGRTEDAALIQRAGMVLKRMFRTRKMVRATKGADVIIARNLECLALAVRARRANPNARLVYECLDIHRLLLGKGPAARAIQLIEAGLLRKVDLLIVSSPAFLRAYFDRRRAMKAPTLLMENKLLHIDGAPIVPLPAPDGPPWTIGWFGMLRCRRTFEILTAIAREHEGRVRVLIAGRASPAEFEDFEAQVRAAPHCDYVGTFAAEDLPRLYGRCHFAWAIDYFEQGLNSTWLLPNRLYEASSFGVVPIALRSVETGRWLDRHAAGLLLDDSDPQAQIREVLGGLSDADYGRMRAAVEAIPGEDLVAGRRDCEELLAAVTGG